jgi:bacterioferritin (cytochrome b1)
MFLIGMICIATSCGTVRDLFKSSTTESEDKLDKKKTELLLKKDELAKNNELKLKQIGTVSKGVDHALNVETNRSKPIDVAKELNDRVMSLAGTPDVKDVVRIKKIVDDLISEVEKERKAGASELERLDRELQFVQSDRDVIKKAYEKKINEYEELSGKIAESNDKHSAIVGEMDKWFGLGAVFYGGKKFILSMLTIITVGAILFLVLRVFAQTNPIAGAIFGIFEMVGSWGLHLIKAVIPNSFSYAKFTEKGPAEQYRNTLDRIVDALHGLKEKNSALPEDKKLPLDIVFDEFDRKFDMIDKKIIEERLKFLGWKI